MLLPDRTLCRASPEGSTLTLLRLSPDDSGTYTCLAVNLAGRQTKIYTLFVLGLEDSILSESCSVWRWFTYDLFRLSSSIHLWWDHSAQRGTGDSGQRCDSGVPGSGKPSSADQLAEERTPSAPQSSYSPSLSWLCAEVSSNNTVAKYTWNTVFHKFKLLPFTCFFVCLFVLLFYTQQQFFG